MAIIIFTEPLVELVELSPAKAAFHVDQPLCLELSVEVGGAPNAEREERQSKKKNHNFCCGTHQQPGYLGYE